MHPFPGYFVQGKHRPNHASGARQDTENSRWRLTRGNPGIETKPPEKAWCRPLRKALTSGNCVLFSKSRRNGIFARLGGGGHSRLRTGLHARIFPAPGKNTGKRSRGAEPVHLVAPIPGRALDLDQFKIAGIASATFCGIATRCSGP